MQNAADLPNDIEELKRLVLTRTGERDSATTELNNTKAELGAAKAGLMNKTLEVETLKVQIARLRRMTYGGSSERISREIDQLELRLEDLQSAQAETAAAVPAPSGEANTEKTGTPKTKRRRRNFSKDLPHKTVLHEAPPGPCKGCGGTGERRKVGQSVTKILTYVPGRFEVEEHVRPAEACCDCETMVQAPMPSLPIPRGMAAPSLLAHIAIAKYCDHLPLYRQSEIYARDGVDLDRSLLADWVGRMAWLLSPLVERIGDHVMAGSVIHADDTPVPVLAPGNGKTKTGRLWVYLRDERSHAGTTAPAVLYRYTPDRKGVRCREHLAPFTGHLHADGYPGFRKLYESQNGKPPAAIEVACWAHARRKFYDVHSATGSPLAKEALERIGALFEIEEALRGKSPNERCQARQEKAKPLIDGLAEWFDEVLTKVSGKSALAGAVRYARNRWAALTCYIDDGRLEISNNAAENAIRPIALGRKNYLFAGSDSGGQRAAIFYTLIRTAKLNNIEPETYLREVLTRIGDHLINRIDELLPWNIVLPELGDAARSDLGIAA